MQRHLSVNSSNGRRWIHPEKCKHSPPACQKAQHRSGSINMDQSGSVIWSLPQRPSWSDLGYVIWRRVWSKSTAPPVPYGWDKVDSMKVVWHSAGDENESDLSPLRILLEGLKNNWLSWIYTNALGFVVYAVEHVIFHHRDLWTFVFKKKARARAYAHNIYAAEQPCKLLILSWLHFVHGTSTWRERIENLHHLPF